MFTTRHLGFNFLGFGKSGLRLCAAHQSMQTSASELSDDQDGCEMSAAEIVKAVKGDAGRELSGSD